MEYTVPEFDIKDILVRLRKAHGLNQEELSNILGIKRDTYASWETGRSSPKKEMIVKLSKVYNVSCDYILTGIHSNGALSVASPVNYNSDVYGDCYVSELSNFEKALLLKLRPLNAQDKQKVVEFINELDINEEE